MGKEIINVQMDKDAFEQMIVKGEGVAADIDDLLSGHCFYQRIYANLTTKELIYSPNVSVCADEEGYDSVFKVTSSNPGDVPLSAEGNHRFNLRFILDTGEEVAASIYNNIKLDRTVYYASVYTTGYGGYRTNSFVEISSPTGKKYKIYLEVVE